MEGLCERIDPTEFLVYLCNICLSLSRVVQHDCALVNEMRAVRDKEARDSTKFREMCDASSFGSSSPDTSMSDTALALQNDYPGNNMREALDKEIYTRLLLCSASASLEYFRSALSQLFSDANFVEGKHSRKSLVRRADNPDVLTINVAPVKGLERTMVKFDEYTCGGSEGQWPVAPQIRDTLRATIEAHDGGAFVNAADAIMSKFGVREGNGRFKNNLMMTKHQPPNVLINLVVCPPDMPPITAEVQIYLREIEELNEHHYYEVREILTSV